MLTFTLLHYRRSPFPYLERRKKGKKRKSKIRRRVLEGSRWLQKWEDDWTTVVVPNTNVSCFTLRGLYGVVRIPTVGVRTGQVVSVELGFSSQDKLLEFLEKIHLQKENIWVSLESDRTKKGILDSFFFPFFYVLPQKRKKGGWKHEWSLNFFWLLILITIWTVYYKITSTPVSSFFNQFSIHYRNLHFPPSGLSRI